MLDSALAHRYAAVLPPDAWLAADEKTRPCECDGLTLHRYADGLLNPGKAAPALHCCAECGKLHLHHGRLPHPELPRLWRRS